MYNISDVQRTRTITSNVCLIDNGAVQSQNFTWETKNDSINWAADFAIIRQVTFVTGQDKDQTMYAVTCQQLQSSNTDPICTFPGNEASFTAVDSTARAFVSNPNAVFQLNSVIPTNLSFTLSEVSVTGKLVPPVNIGAGVGADIYAFLSIQIEFVQLAE